MKKDLGIVDAIYPMPVLMVAAYDENGKVNVMNAAWGQIADDDKVIIFIGEGKKTWLNILASKAFTVALADEKHMDVADFFGIASGNKIDDKFERTGYHAVRSDKVNAPIIEEFPVVMECELLEHLKDEYVSAIVGRIVNVKADDGHTYRCLKLAYLESENGKPYKKIVDFFVSDDANHIPVRLDLHLRFGSAKAFLIGYKGVKGEIKSRVK